MTILYTEIFVMTCDPEGPALEARGRIVGKALEASSGLYPSVKEGRTVAPMEFRILGPLEVADGDGLRPLGGPKQRTVLANLVLRVNQIVDSDRLIGEVWGDEPPPSVRSTLRGYVSHLRKALGPGLVEHSSGGYVLRVERSAIDAVRFEALVAEGRAVMSADAAAAARTFEQALGLWRGTALGDLADQVSLQPEIARLEELRLAALEDRITAELELGRHRELVPELETLVGAHPFRERLWLHLMTALYRSERQADALAAFHRARDLLAEELGIDPSPNSAGSRSGSSVRITRSTSSASLSAGTACSTRWGRDPSGPSIEPTNPRSAGRWRLRPSARGSRTIRSSSAGSRLRRS